MRHHQRLLLEKGAARPSELTEVVPRIASGWRVVRNLWPYVWAKIGQLCVFESRNGKETSPCPSI